MKNRILWFAFALTSLMSCKNYKCSEAVTQIGFIKFLPSETDTIIVRRFTKGSNFNSKVDTFLLDKNSSNSTLATDTFTVYHAFGNDMGIVSRYDYEIYIPPINRLYRLTEITEDVKELNQGLFSTSKVGCINPMISHRQNGLLQNLQDRFGNIYFVK